MGTRPGTQVTVTSSAYTEAGDAIAAMSPGTTQAFTLDEGEAVQVVTALPADCPGTVVTNDCQQPDMGVTCTYCDAGADHDPTGTLIEATAPVAVIAGHTCAFVPFDTWACDHLEEQLPPLTAWGRSFIVGRTEPQHDVGFPVEPNRLRLLSGADGNTVALDPPQVVSGVEVALLALDAGTQGAQAVVTGALRGR